MGHHWGEPRQEAGGRNWSRGHGTTLPNSLLNLLFRRCLTACSTADRLSSGLRLLTWIIYQEHALQTCTHTGQSDGHNSSTNQGSLFPGVFKYHPLVGLPKTLHLRVTITNSLIIILLELYTSYIPFSERQLEELPRRCQVVVPGTGECGLIWGERIKL